MRNTLRWTSDTFAESSRQALQICIVVAVITLLARLPFLIQPGFSIDSYLAVLGSPNAGNFLQQGRFGQYLLLVGTESLGVDTRTLGTLLQGPGLACFAAAVPLLFMTFGTHTPVPRMGVVLASLIITLHPFSAEMLTFPEASFAAHLSTALGILSVYLVARHPGRWWLSAVLLVVALSLYQMLLNYVGLMLLFGAVQLLLREDAAGRSIIDRLRPMRVPVLMVVAGVAVYLLIGKLVVAGAGIAVKGRSQLLALDALSLRMDEMGRLSAWLWKSPLIVSEAPAAGILLWSCSLLGWAAFMGWLLVRHSRASAVGLLITALIPLAAIGIVGVTAAWWPVPRVLGGIVVAWAMGVYWLLVLSPPRWRWVPAIPVALVLLGTAGVGHRIYNDQIKLNRIDRHLAGEIFRSLNTLPGYKNGTQVAIVNRNMQWAHPLPLSTSYMDMNMTAFAFNGTQKGVLQMTVGRPVNIINPTPAHALICDTIPFWPTAGFTAMTAAGDAVVCL